MADYQQFQLLRRERLVQVERDSPWLEVGYRALHRAFRFWHGGGYESTGVRSRITSGKAAGRNGSLMATIRSS